MRVAFCGKGGSGKSTISSLFIRKCREQGRKVLAIDADINMHMAQSLGLTSEQRANVVQLDQIKEKLIKHITSTNEKTRHLKKPPRTLSPMLNSGFVDADFHRGFLADWPRVEQNLFILATGTYEEEDVGWSCHHGKLGDLQIMLNHLIDKDEVIVADMTAGTDAFGVGIFSLFDIIYWVVEPTSKSIELFKLFQPLAEAEKLNYRIIINKLDTQEDLDYLLANLPSEKISAKFSVSRFVKAIERNQAKSLSELEGQNKQSLGELYKDATSVKRDWDKLYEHILANHMRAAEKWPKEKYNYDLKELVDPRFSFDKILNELKK